MVYAETSGGTALQHELAEALFQAYFQQGKDVGVLHATPADRILMVWPLTLVAWEFKEPNVVQPRLQRHVVRIVRSRD